MKYRQSSDWPLNVPGCKLHISEAGAPVLQDGQCCEGTEREDAQISGGGGVLVESKAQEVPRK